MKEELPLLPWAKALRDSRKEEDEPYLYCTPMGVPRANPYPWRIVQSYTAKGPTHYFILHENGGGGAFRQIFMDGRKHPEDTIPTWFGHSIGRWDGDTLVIDTVGYNDKFWMDSSGTPHTEQMHTIERLARPNYGTLTNDFTLEDPGAFQTSTSKKGLASRSNHETATAPSHARARDHHVGGRRGFWPGHRRTRRPRYR